VVCVVCVYVCEWVVCCVHVVVVVGGLRKYTQSMWGREAKDRNAGRDGPPSCRHPVSGAHSTTHARHHPATRPRAGTPVSGLGVVCMSCGDGGAVSPRSSDAASESRESLEGLRNEAGVSRRRRPSATE